MAFTIAPALLAAPMASSGCITSVHVLSGLHKAMRDDLANVFFSVSDFSFTRPATYTHIRRNVSIVYNCLFSAEHSAMKMENFTLSSAEPEATFQQSKFKYKPVLDDSMVIDGIKYTVRDIQPDGFGVVKLMLRRV